MGPRLLCFVAGLAGSAFFVYTGFLATPFFGADSMLWAAVLASFLLSLAAGFGLGDVLSRLVAPKALEGAPGRLAVAGGGLAWLALYFLPTVCRSVLSGDSSWGTADLAPAISIVMLTLVPGAVIAAVAPSVLRALTQDSEDAKGTSRRTLRLVALTMLGCGMGVLAFTTSLVRADKIDVFVRAYGAAAILIVFGAIFSKTKGRIAAGVLIVCLGALTALRPSEIQTPQFAVALDMERADEQGASLYYQRTAFQGQGLSQEEIQRRYEAMTQASGTKKSGVILTCEMLLALGEVPHVDGTGIVQTLRLLLSEEGQEYVLPPFEQIESVRADGNGVIWARIKHRRGQDGATFSLPGAEPGEQVDFVFKDDFTIKITKAGNVWKLEFGPRTTERAGVLEFHDTLTTPVRIVDVVGWVDASLHAILFEDYPDQVVVKAVAQGTIGGISTVEVVALPKEEASE